MEELALEQELQEHLTEQKSSLDELDAALAIDGSNEELQQIREQLFAAINAAEESLHHLRHTRLLEEPHAAQPSVLRFSADADEVTGSVTTAERLDPDGQELQQTAGFAFVAGSKCRFRHTDGRWYNGRVIGLEGHGLARVCFLTPTVEKMQICRFYLQQRCRFGSTCRLSHGFAIPSHSLHQFISPDLGSIPLGSTILACARVDENSSALWRPAELEEWDSRLQLGRVVFIDDGQKADVKADQVALSEYAASDDSEDSSDTGSQDGDVGDEVEQPSQIEAVHATFGLGAFPVGPQTDTVVFARWEKHTRGVASKMMAGMGYREGMGLGKEGQGIVDPVQVKTLPKNQSLEFALDTSGHADEADGSSKKKKSRGGKRKRDKKWAMAALAGKGEEERGPDVFGFINHQLAGQIDEPGKVDIRSTRLRHLSPSRKTRVDRSSLVAQEDEVNELRSRVTKLEEMANRNRKEKPLFQAVVRKLEEARKALADAESNHASATNALQSKEKEKKWLRF